MSINEILTNDINSIKQKILFLYTGYDCQSCVDKGYEIIKEMEEVGYKVFVVSSHSNIGFDQERNDYFEYVYADEKELIRKERN